MKLYLRFLLLVLSCVLLILSFNDNLGFLAWFALIPYFLAVSNSSIRSAIFLSFIYGLSFFAGITIWFTQYSYVYWFPMLGVLSLFFIFYGAVFNLIYKKIATPYLRILLISSVWAAVEFFRHRTFLAFPWGVLGYSQHEYLAVMQLSRITGVLGVSILILLSNLCIVELLNYFYAVRNPALKYLRKGKSWPGGLLKNQAIMLTAIVVFLISANILSGYILLSGSRNNYLHDNYPGEKLNVAMVQPNISFDDKFKKDTVVLIPEKTGKEGRYFLENTELVVYPESVIWGSLDRDRNSTFYNWVKNTAANENLYFIMGQILWDEEENYYNSVVLYDPGLNELGRYNKIHPLPFAEYMPYPDVIGFLSFLNIAKLNITPARQFILINYPGIGSIGTNICFESTLQVISRKYRKIGADALFTFTDTAGFKESDAARHHLMFSRVRAIENASFMLHSGNNGISAAFDPYGRIIASSGIGKKDVIYASIYFNPGKTFYTRFGELALYAYSAISFLILLIYIAFNIKNKVFYRRDY